MSRKSKNNKHENKIDSRIVEIESIPEIEEIIRDRIHGSSWILLKTVELLKRIDPSLRAHVCAIISSAHPAMAGLRILYKMMSKNPHLDVEKMILEVNKKTSENLRNLVAEKIVTTISRSHIVEEGLLEAKRVIILESKPGKEGEIVAKRLEERGVEVYVIPDASMGYAVKESDFVVSGADSLFEKGFVNKVGTLPLALTSSHFGKPFIVASPSYKFLEGSETAALPETGIQETAVSWDGKCPLFEFVDVRYVSSIVWEKGLLPDPNDMTELRMAVRVLDIP